MVELAEDGGKEKMKSYMVSLQNNIRFQSYHFSLKEVGMFGGTWAVEAYTSFLNKIILRPIFRVTRDGKVFIWREENRKLAEAVEAFLF